MTEPVVSLGVLNSAGFAGDPYDFYRRWREGGSVRRVSGADAWLVLDYEQVSSVLRRPADFSSSPNREFSPALHGADPPAHTKMRRLLQPFFSTELQLARSDRIRELARNGIEKLRRRRDFDAIGDFTAPMVRALACDWLGLQEKGAEAITGRHLTGIAWSDVEPYIVPGGLLDGCAESSGVDERVLGELTGFLLTAGIETVREFVLFGMLALSRNREFIGRAAADEPSIPSLVDELLRLEPPVHTITRRARRDVTLGSSVIPAGDMVWASLAAANRDPAAFADPDLIILSRSARRHLSFGGGPHFCLGNQLGRLESEIILSELLPHLGALLDHGSQPVVRFSGPHGAPSLRQIARWRLSFG